MDAFPDSRQDFGEDDFPLGPARPGPSGGAAEHDSELLPPFAPGERPAPADAGDDLPWLVTAAETSAAEGAAVEGAGHEQEWAPHPATAAQHDDSADADRDVPAWLELEGEEEEPGEESPEPDADAGEGTPTADGAAGAARLAERFESVARLLRARGVAGVLEDGRDDPLGLLLTGFALGYLQRDEAGHG